MSSADGAAASSVDILRLWAEDAPEDVATFHRADSGEWVPTTASALWTQVRRLSAALASLGLRPGDRLAIIVRTCREWQIAEQAAALCGAIVVGIDPGASSEQVASIVANAGVSVVVAESRLQLGKLEPAARAALTFAVVVDDSSQNSSESNVYRLADLIERESSVEQTTRSLDTNSAAILIYTSGTTGASKGIEYTHAQLMVACQSMLAEFPDLRERNRLVCWLPMAALFQRMMNLVGLASRSVTYFVENPRDIMSAVSEVRPTLFFSVPRFYEKVYEGIHARLEAQTGWRRRLATAALASGRQHAAALAGRVGPGWWLRLRYSLFDRLVLQRIRAAFGGDIKWMITGSAAAPVWLLEFFHGIGLPLLEAYGITENPVPIAANRPHAYRFGSVGKPFRVNHLRLSAEGEVLVKGPALFKGYRGDDTARALFTDDGFYRTGDLGRFDEDGFLFLTGRMAELIKTSTGRRVSPVGIEDIYRRGRYIEHVVVIGNNRPYLTALVTPNGSAIRAALRLEDTGALPLAETLRLVESDFADLGRQLARHEQVRTVRLLPEPLAAENGTLTATLKLRRGVIETRHAALIEDMYRGAANLRDERTS